MEVFSIKLLDVITTDEFVVITIRVVVNFTNRNAQFYSN